MRKLLLSLCLLLMISSITSPAKALPGMSLPELRGWVAAHPFLHHELIGPLPTLNASYALAYKQLDEQLFLDLDFTFIGADDNSDQALAVELLLVQKDYRPASEDDIMGDPRPWVTTALTATWSRSSPRALQLLSQVFSPELAEDFRQARLIYTGPEYVAAIPACYFRENIANFRYRIYVWAPQVDILQGQRYSYEISTLDGRGGQQPGQSLKILARASGLESARILAHNRWVAKLDQARKARRQP